jgi:hypothetical protein
MEDKNATLEDVFIHYASETLDSGNKSDYRAIRRDRKTAERVG